MIDLHPRQYGANCTPPAFDCTTALLLRSGDYGVVRGQNNVVTYKVCLRQGSRGTMVDAPLYLGRINMSAKI